MAVNWMVTGNYLVVHYGSGKPCIIEKENEKHQKILSLLVSGAPEDKIIAELDFLNSIKNTMPSSLSIDDLTGIVKINGKETHGIITDYIVEYWKKSLPYEALVKFWENIQQNPSQQSKDHLFLFLKANKMPITPDGCFLAYKRVKYDNEKNLVDCYSGTFCNNVGAKVVMDRKSVNPDRHDTCSHGLHVAAFQYMAAYSGDVIVEVKVNPKDVVAVPSDYNDQKMRVCEYEVVGINKETAMTELFIAWDKIEVKKQEGILKIETGKKEHADQVAVDAFIANAQKGQNLDISAFTAKQIIEIVQKLADITINLSLKNKKSIVKKANLLLIQAGYDTVNSNTDR